MNIIVNGENAEINELVTIAGLLKDRDVKMPDMVTVELNGDILDKAAFDDTVLKEGDKVEFLYFMGGGAPEVSG